MAIEDEIEILKRQEEVLRFARFSEDDAWRLGSTMRERAAAEGLPLVIDITLAGRPLFYAALAGTTPDNREWVRRKINVVMRYSMSSYRKGRELAAAGSSLNEDRGVLPIDMAAHGGSFPIHLEGTGVVGAVTVSGIPQRHDHGFVVDCLCRFLGVDPVGIALPKEK